MAQEFKVDPDDIETAARELWKIAEDNTRAVRYAQEWLDVQSSGGILLSPVLDQLQDACNQLKSNYERLGSVTHSSSTELNNAGKLYRTQDSKTSKTMDSYYEELGK
ncbi:hypothetical protein IU433_16375 [Nocardia puris]|uniref:Excreted virulence factor EspC (Type VII ESX diderm) n=1 Tax=Nocardia puris TaxID=208602 RepID=A0A366DBM0_9NOCA|nr:type VII secretion target [Nocardia puris]MBF6211743.1 hypothetical protein [Nocardia puris]MBF6365746.1 hypothetical protein [Nocardia puris]MBF6460611.1 hypothetical protein [Nocardia puris]RBO86919.1 excreted virulence factor EspC (type VII ESX diderm) [Nocardia puris]